MLRTGIVAVLVVLAGAAGWWLRGAAPVARTAEPGLDLPGGGVRITLVQRRDAAVPGSAGRLRVHIGDITRGQVELTMTRADGTALVPVRSVRAGDVVEFPVGDRLYRLTVVELRNLLVGDDSAVLEFAAGPTARDRIETLLEAVETSGLVFLRNGGEYDGPAAARHLRTKLRAFGDRVRTPSAFIENIATRSSLSGRPYEVRLADGTVVALAAWLRRRSGPGAFSPTAATAR